MRRFLLLALPLLVLLIALFNWALEQLGTTPDLGPLVGWRGGEGGLPGAYVVGAWMLEALALCSLFLLVAGRGGWMLTSGLASAWMAWVFRGPLLVLTVAAAGERTTSWWPFAWRWFVLYTIAGLLLAALARVSPPFARRQERSHEAAAVAEPEAPSSVTVSR